jgi:hypothetical protein
LSSSVTGAPSGAPSTLNSMLPNGGMSVSWLVTATATATVPPVGTGLGEIDIAVEVVAGVMASSASPTLHPSVAFPP